MAISVTKWNGTSFATDGTLDNPVGKNSTIKTTLQTEILADGSEGAVVPTTKSWRTLNLSWLGRSSTMLSKLEAYVSNANILKITDLKSNTYCGMFTSVTHEETSGEITYDITAEFRQVFDPS